jgi:hypothetical protein
MIAVMNLKVPRRVGNFVTPQDLLLLRKDSAAWS